MRAQRTRKLLPIFRSGDLTERVSVEARLPEGRSHRVSAPPNLAGGDHLDSWKEIAAHLKRTVRTVQRWETSEGLPVHRHTHLKGSTVYAFKTEIDVWLTGRGQTQSEAHAMQKQSKYTANGWESIRMCKG